MELGPLCSYAFAGGRAPAQKKVGKKSSNDGKTSSKQKQKQQQPKAAAAATTATTASRVLVEVPRQQTSELFYITTAINYTNGPPHIGHAYEGITTDIIARYHRTYGRIVEFLTGTDEHGTKIAQTAENRTELLKTASPKEIEALEKKWKMQLNGKKIIEPIDICDHYAAGFKRLNVALSVDSDKFIRTTEDYHKKTAQALFSKCLARGDIYLGQYKGWYNVKEEQFVTPQEAEATEFKDPASGVPYEWREEPSYYFRMGNYQAQLLEHITKNPGFIQPEKHRNLIKKRLEDDKLLDLSISRHISKLKHGVPLPNDKEHVMYVWFDALTNYISGLGWPSAKADKFFPTCTHIIGKDILWFHCVIWPCMLMSGEVPLPKTIFGHGWVLDKHGKKMSKSIGNVVDPWDVVAKFPLDTLRLYLARETTYGNDLRFSIESLVNLNNSELADTLGNLVNRLTKLAKGQVPDVAVTESGTKLPFNIAGVKADVDACFAEYNLKGATEVILTALRDTNKWIADAKPWTIKDKVGGGSRCYLSFAQHI